MSKRKIKKTDRLMNKTADSPASMSEPAAQLHLEIDDAIAQSSLSISQPDDVQLVEAVTELEPAALWASGETTAHVESSQLASFADVSECDSTSSAPSPAHDPEAPLAQRLRAIREVRGISCEEMARRLRVAPAVIRDIESNHWERLGAPVYIRGHLNSYARELDVPAVVVAHALKDIDEPIALVPTAPPARSSEWWARHSSALTYVVLTVLLAVPILSQVKLRGVNSEFGQIRNLDEEGESSVASLPLGQLDPSLASAASAPNLPTPSDLTPTLPAPAPPSIPDKNVMMASMAPLGNSESAPGSHRIELSFTADSWIEVIDQSGAKLDYGIARAGEKREHLVDGSVAMSIGNVSGAALRIDGQPVDLSQYARLNVARLKLFETEPTSTPASR